MKQENQKSLFLLCGTPGSGKSTWCRKQLQNTKYNCAYISRDEIRFSLLKDGEEYFSHEDEVFSTFIQNIQNALNEDKVVFADATHLTEKSRNKTLDLLDLNNVDIYPVAFNIPLQTCLNQNEFRKDTKSYVPRGVIRRMYNSYVTPKENEKYHYKHILVIGDLKKEAN